jgi:hypothetical protein
MNRVSCGSERGCARRRESAPGEHDVELGIERSRKLIRAVAGPVAAAEARGNEFPRNESSVGLNVAFLNSVSVMAAPESSRWVPQARSAGVGTMLGLAGSHSLLDPDGPGVGVGALETMVITPAVGGAAFSGLLVRFLLTESFSNALGVSLQPQHSVSS